MSGVAFVFVVSRLKLASLEAAPEAIAKFIAEKDFLPAQRLRSRQSTTSTQYYVKWKGKSIESTTFVTAGTLNWYGRFLRFIESRYIFTVDHEKLYCMFTLLLQQYNDDFLRVWFVSCYNAKRT